MSERLRLPEFVTPDFWLDDNHAVELMYRPPLGGQTVAATPYSIRLWHWDKRTDGDWCVGMVPWDNPDGLQWNLHSLDPLHLEPSVHCLTCGDHGHIRDGKWEAV